MSLGGRLSSLLGSRRHVGASAPSSTYGPIPGPAGGGVAHVSFHRPSLTAAQLWALTAGAIVLLGVLVAADVGAVESARSISHVTAVNWYADGQLLASSPGFSIHASRTVTLTLTCSLICYNFDGASANAPFHVVGFSVVDQPIQYANVTLRAPSSAYTGPLSITLGVP